MLEPAISSTFPPFPDAAVPAANTIDPDPASPVERPVCICTPPDEENVEAPVVNAMSPLLPATSDCIVSTCTSPPLNCSPPAPDIIDTEPPRKDDPLSPVTLPA